MTNYISMKIFSGNRLQQQERTAQTKKGLLRSFWAILALGGVLSVTASNAQNAVVAQTPPNLSNVTLRVAKYKGGWDLQLKLAGLDKFPYKVEFTEFTGGNLMTQAINANAIDLASGSEIPPIFGIQSNAALRLIASTRGPTIAQTLLVPKNSKAKTVADLKGKKIGYVKATTAHYFLIKMLEEVGLSLKDINAVALSIPDGLSAFRRGDLDGWATYGYAIAQAKKDGARELKSARNILSGNFLIYAAPTAVADPNKKAAIADFLCRIKKSQDWREASAKNLDNWSTKYAEAIGVEKKVVLDDAKEGLKQRRSQLFPISQPAIASQQNVADTFAKTGVITSRVNVAPLWDGTFTDAINKCK
ncbi:ABC transporter substrate-binding protein [Calothrix sp. PCC 7507]|uniref:ABC transporter substrate-binding protein n=1 Tax=Calothrix sp. PCC 7507 TaxID=99598 RepID=UPI001F2F0827|nr:ABC transporter substrate-binding protein [Calothrix sp. PCC 7507]